MHPPQPDSPTVWRRWLALQLRRLRLNRDLTQRQAGKAVGKTHAHVSNIETAQQAIGLEDLERLLTAYDVPEHEQQVLFLAAERARQHGWWEQYDRREVPEWFSLYIGLEQGAAAIHTYHSAFIIGLLQTPEYASALLRTGVMPRTNQHVERLVELRMKRQRILHKQPNPLDLSLVLDEAALRRVVGSPAIMVGQIERLIEAARLPNVDLRVLPFSAAKMTVPASFNIVEFPWPYDPGLLYIEIFGGAIFMDQREEIDLHRLAFDHLHAISLGDNASIQLLEEVARDHKHQ